MTQFGATGRWLAAALGIVLACGDVTSLSAQEIAFPSIPRSSTSFAEFRNVRDLGGRGDGVTDDTEAFQQAIAARKKPPHEWTWIYVPNGTYLLSDTLAWPRRCYLIGQSTTGVVLKLRDGCPGFGDPARPKPVLHTGIPGKYYDNDAQANAAFHNYILNLTVDTGRGNPGAVAVKYTTHNQGILGEVVVRSADGRGVTGVDLPYFRTENGSISATYFQYACAPGKARALQAVQVRDGTTRELRLDAGNLNVGLYRSVPATPAKQ